MKLNSTSYIHIKIRKLCQFLAYMMKMELTTDLSEEFSQIRFTGKYSYLTIDYNHKTCFAMSHRITKKEQEIVEEIMICCQWLETGRRYQILHKK